MRQAWSMWTHAWYSGQPLDDVESHTIFYPGLRYPLSWLMQHPVDILTVERGHILSQPSLAEAAAGTRWWRMVLETSLVCRPRVIIETWDGRSALWANGPVAKLEKTRWQTLGYQTRCKEVSAVRVGGAITQERLFVIRISKYEADQWEWDDTILATQDRSMGNLLQPDGLVSRHLFHETLPTHVHHVSDPITDPMPYQHWQVKGAWITCPKGYRQILPEEVGNALGLTKSSCKVMKATGGIHVKELLLKTTSLFHWEFLSNSLMGLLDPNFVSQYQSPMAKRVQAVSEDIDMTTFTLLKDRAKRWKEYMLEHPPADTPEFSWKPPNLQEGGSWFKEQWADLEQAVASYPGREKELLKEGAEILKIHRQNYNDQGPCPKQLQLIWWEFPELHWTPIREGSPMNFIQYPPSVIHPNGKMDEDATRIAGEFADELISLGVLRPHESVETNAPLFAIPKAGQPGEYRTICNMKDGGQNAYIAGDPVYLNRPAHILSQMYAGGFTAILDGSKFFYQFRTHPDDRPYLGTLHPVTGELYVYWGLPMGSADSPALAGRYGLAFLRLLREHHAAFGTDLKANCWWTGFEGLGYDPELGYGILMLRPDGKPAVRLWVHVDDFMIHGPDYESTAEALKFFLDASVKVGLLCHPKKLKPPSQVQEYTGFIFDTRGIPCLRVPTNKREKASAMVDYVLSTPPTHLFSGLALSVVSGVLESLVEATPSRVGRTYLRRLHDCIHSDSTETGLHRYCRTVPLSSDARVDLGWWQQILLHEMHRFAYSSRSAVLVPTWGDGSGTGTGGTVQIPDLPLNMWMGQWSPFVFRNHSGWKELKTLLLTLQQTSDSFAEAVRGTTLFYFTDNYATYWIAANGTSKKPHLHKLIQEIKLLELSLDCTLQVVHVPGTSMINQGTDGLSRGIWVSELHPTVDQNALTASIFAPVPFHRDVVNWILHLGQVSGPWRYQDWRGAWQPAQLLHVLTVWMPPPELARQAIIFTLELWVESPLDTSAVFIVPRSLSGAWQYLSRYVTELYTILPNEIPCLPQPLLQIPIVVLYLAPHIRTLPMLSNGQVDSHTPTNLHWHRQQAENMRGMP